MTSPKESEHWDRMISGQAFEPLDPYIAAKTKAASGLLDIVNGQGSEAEREHALRRLLDIESDVRVTVRGQFTCEFGGNIHIKAAAPDMPDWVFINYGCTILDNGPVNIHAPAAFGPGVHIYAVEHPLDPSVRQASLLNKGFGSTYTRSVTIGAGCLIGGRSIILPGVSIGEGTTIGAGSVVTRDIPAFCTAAGSPCRVLRYLNSADSSVDDRRLDDGSLDDQQIGDTSKDISGSS